MRKAIRAAATTAAASSSTSPRTSRSSALTRLFGCKFANVQPNSGSQANQAVFLALLQPGDTFMGLDLAAGGHLTHGSSVNMSGKWFKAVSYGVNPDTQMIDMDNVAQLAREQKPKLIIAGGSAYARHWDFAASAPSPMRSAPISSSTWRISPGSSRAARIRRRSRMGMSSRRRRTRRCAARAAASC